MYKRYLSSLRTIVALLFMVFSTNLAATTAAFAENDHQATEKVTICHRTNSTTNPYTEDSVSFDAASGDLIKDNGNGDHASHTGPVFDSSATYPSPHNGDQWGDIIPAHGTYPGLNWDATGQAIWNNNCNIPAPQQDIHVTAAAVTFKDECGTDQDSYTVPSTTGVIYSKAAGTYPGTGTVTITATAANSYILDGTNNWTHAFTNVPCTQEVTPTGVTFIDLCGTTNDKYVIPNQAGVDYSVNGNVQAVGDHTGSGTVTVNAVAQTGYVLKGTSVFSHIFTNNDCRVTLCHSAGQSGNYTKITTDAEGAFNGHLDDNFGGTHGDHQNGMDIIPPFTYEGHTYSQNWNIVGQTIWENGCDVPLTPTDVCPNIVGVQTSVPEGKVLNDEGNCVTPTPPADECPNLPGSQQAIPSGYVKDSHGDCIVPGMGGGDTGDDGDTTPDTPSTPIVDILGGRGGAQLNPAVSTTSSKTGEVLVNTGSNVLVNLFAGMFILGLTAGITQASRKRVYQS